MTGDPSQIDLDDPTQSGLIDAVRRLHRIQGVETVAMGREDIVRHRLVQRIVEAYGSETVARAMIPLRPRLASDPESEAGQ